MVDFNYLCDSSFAHFSFEFIGKGKRGREKGDGKNSVINCRKTVVNCRDAL